MTTDHMTFLSAQVKIQLLRSGNLNHHLQLAVALTKFNKSTVDEGGFDVLLFKVKTNVRRTHILDTSLHYPSHETNDRKKSDGRQTQMVVNHQWSLIVTDGKGAHGDDSRNDWLRTVL